MCITITAYIIAILCHHYYCIYHNYILCASHATPAYIIATLYEHHNHSIYLSNSTTSLSLHISQLYTMCITCNHCIYQGNTMCITITAYIIAILRTSRSLHISQLYTMCITCNRCIYHGNTMCITITAYITAINIMCITISTYII